MKPTYEELEKKVEELEKQKSELEEQVIASQRLPSLGGLTGGIAHDFSSTLTAIMGYCELLGLKKGNEKIRDGILKATERGSDLIKQILGYSRQGKYNPVPLNINDLIKNTSKLWVLELENNKIKENYHYGKNIHTIYADKTQMGQVLVNIVINAKDAMPDGGKITFKTENIHVDEEYVKKYSGLNIGDYVKISITDTGTGMTEEVKNRIFEPYFTTKENQGGFGLGLSVVYQIIKNHKGDINVISELKKGTTFKIYLPVKNK